MKKQKRVLSLMLAIVMALALMPPEAFAAKIDVSNMPGHEILAALPETLERPARPTTLEQADVYRGLFGTKWDGDESVLQEVVDLTDSLTAGKTTDKEKMKAIYDWVSQNIEYDSVAYSYWYMKPEDRTMEQSQRMGEASETFHVYVNRRAVCSGYTNLCWLMGAIAGIPVAVISGYAVNGSHAWNATLVDGKWLFFDATWKLWDMAPDYHVSSGGFECYDGLYQIQGYIWDNVDRIEVVFRPGFECPASVTIPSYATEIGGDAFRGRTGLERVAIHASVTQIGPMAFQDCVNLKSVNIPNGVTEINNYIFSGCTSLESITIPDSVTRIWAWAFADCVSLKSVDIPDSVTNIGQCAFSGCTGLESVTVGTGITKEAADREHVFDGCSGLKNMTFANGGTGIGTDAFFTIENGVLTRYGGYGGLVTIPEGVTEIGLSAFVFSTDPTSITGVTFPGSMTKIGDCAFSGCTGLTSVTIPSSVTSIGDSAFYGCTGLTSVTIPASVTEMGFNVFNGCTGLKSVTISDGVTKISSAFAHCKGLTSVTIPGSVKNTGSAFSGCTGLKSVTIREGVTEIGAMTFSGCTGLTSVTLPDGVISIDNAAFDNCTGLKSITIPASVTKINRLAFRGCTGLTDVYYGGTEDQWKAINISKEANDALISATIHYNSAMPQKTVTAPAIPTNDTLKVDGEVKEATVYKINGANYFRIRDVAMLLSGSSRQVEVGYDAATNSVTLTTGKPYTPNGSELSGLAPATGTATSSNDTIYIDGQRAELTVYKIDGANYFKLRDLGIALDFNVGWTQAEGMYIEPNKPYDPAD